MFKAWSPCCSCSAPTARGIRRAAQVGGEKVTDPGQIDALRRTLEDVLGPRRQLSRSASKRPKLADAADQKKALLYNLMGAPQGLCHGCRRDSRS